MVHNETPGRMEWPKYGMVWYGMVWYGMDGLSGNFSQCIQQHIVLKHKFTLLNKTTAAIAIILWRICKWSSVPLFVVLSASVSASWRHGGRPKWLLFCL